MIGCARNPCGMHSGGCAFADCFNNHIVQCSLTRRSTLTHRRSRSAASVRRQAKKPVKASLARAVIHSRADLAVVLWEDYRSDLA